MAIGTPQIPTYDNFIVFGLVGFVLTRLIDLGHVQGLIIDPRGGHSSYSNTQ